MALARTRLVSRMVLQSGSFFFLNGGLQPRRTRTLTAVTSRGASDTATIITTSWLCV